MIKQILVLRFLNGVELIFWDQTVILGVGEAILLDFASPMAFYFQSFFFLNLFFSGGRRFLTLRSK